MHFTLDTFLAIAGIILGIVAIIMTLPPLFQMFWGRAKPLAEYTASSESGDLFCSFYHKPVGRFLRKIGVKRENEPISAEFLILNKNTGQPVGDKTYAIFLLPREGINSQLSYQNPAMFKVVEGNESGAQICRRKQWDSPVLLAYGRYVCVIDLSFPERNESQRFRKEFIAGRPSESRWLD